VAAVHEAEVRKTDLDVQQHREEAAREAERNKGEAEAQQRREDAAAVARRAAGPHARPLQRQIVALSRTRTLPDAYAFPLRILTAKLVDSVQ
jgi:hypothetical protein